MKSATQTFLEQHTPAAIADQQKRMAALTEAQIATLNINGRTLLDHAPTAQALADLCLGMGFLGGWRGRVDDFNQGVLYSAHMIVDAVGPANKPRFLKLIADTAAQRLNTNK